MSKKTAGFTVTTVFLKTSGICSFFFNIIFFFSVLFLNLIIIVIFFSFRWTLIFEKLAAKEIHRSADACRCRHIL